MAVLAADAPKVFEGETLFSDHPVVASDILYQGGAVGLVDASGHARPLVAGDRFVGIAEAKADNSAGSAADINVHVRRKGVAKLSVSGAVITDVGQPVYASEDATYVFSPVDNSFVGVITRWISSGVVMVAYDVDTLEDPYGSGVKETVSVNKTLDVEDTGKTFFVDTDAKIITLPATTTGLANVKIVNIGAFGAVLVAISPQSADKIMGPDLGLADNTNLNNTKATARRGDYVVLSDGHADGWTVEDISGTWVSA